MGRLITLWDCCNVIGETFKLRPQCMALDAPRVLLDAMCVHMNQSAVQIRGCVALGAIVHEEAAIQSAAVEAGAIPVVLRGIEEHPDCIMALEAACALLGALAKGNTQAMLACGEAGCLGSLKHILVQRGTPPWLLHPNTRPTTKLRYNST